MTSGTTTKLKAFAVVVLALIVVAILYFAPHAYVPHVVAYILVAVSAALSLYIIKGKAQDESKLLKTATPEAAAEGGGFALNRNQRKKISEAYRMYKIAQAHCEVIRNDPSTSPQECLTHVPWVLHNIKLGNRHLKDMGALQTPWHI